MPSSDPAYFKAIPWCAELLADPNYVIAPSRYGAPIPGGRGAFFTTTLATDATIKACIYQIRSDTRLQHDSDVPSPRAAVSEVRALMDTAGGVNGFPGVAHGGFVAAIIDEVMGFLINSNRAAATESTAVPGNGAAQPYVPMSAPGSAVMTAELTTTYRRPVPTGEVLLLRTWIESVEGRKMYVRATIEAAERRVLAEGRALFLALKPGVKPGGKGTSVERQGGKL